MPWPILDAAARQEVEVRVDADDAQVDVGRERPALAQVHLQGAAVHDEALGWVRVRIFTPFASHQRWISPLAVGFIMRRTM